MELPIFIFPWVKYECVLCNAVRQRSFQEILTKNAEPCSASDFLYLVKCRFVFFSALLSVCLPGVALVSCYSFVFVFMICL